MESADDAPYYGMCSSQSHEVPKCPIFLSKLAAKSWRLQKPVLRACRSASCRTASHTFYTEAPDLLKNSICRPIGSLTQYKKHLQHLPECLERATEPGTAAEPAANGSPLDTFCKEWPTSNESGGDCDEHMKPKISENVSTNHKMFVLCTKKESETEISRSAVSVRVENIE